MSIKLLPWLDLSNIEYIRERSLIIFEDALFAAPTSLHSRKFKSDKHFFLISMTNYLHLPFDKFDIKQIFFSN